MAATATWLNDHLAHVRQMSNGLMPNVSDPSMIQIAIVTGSTRPGRNDLAVAQWVHDVAKARKRPDAEFELADLADYTLPLLNEPMPPARKQYQHPHTKAWSAKVESFDAYVFVTPEYNHGPSAALKN